MELVRTSDDKEDLALGGTSGDEEDLELGSTSDNEEENWKLDWTTRGGRGSWVQVALPNPSQSSTLRHPVPLKLPQAQMYKPGHTWSDCFLGWTRLQLQALAQAQGPSLEFAGSAVG